ncbi:MAG: MoaD/ThiS family protein [Thermodesulfobacteriota bacterium]
MIIHVRTVGILRGLKEGAKTFSLEVAEGISVKQLISYLQLPEWEVGFILVNNQPRSQEVVLQDQDHITLVAPLAGG